jgi:hypothetical protein
MQRMAFGGPMHSMFQRRLPRRRRPLRCRVHVCPSLLFPVAVLILLDASVFFSFFLFSCHLFPLTQSVFRATLVRPTLSDWHSPGELFRLRDATHAAEYYNGYNDGEKKPKT